VLDPKAGLIWGSVRWSGSTTWLSLAAPYFCDLLTFLSGYCLLRARMGVPRWVQVQIFVVCLISPIINSLYNYQGIWHNPRSDVARVAAAISWPWVTGWFLLSLTTYALGIYILLRQAKNMRPA
jgi:hypothetical protein